MNYNFKLSRNKEIDKLIRKFDKQIKNEYLEYSGDKDKCPSYWHKLLFINTLDFTIDDWKKLRTKEYYYIRDRLEGIEQNKFILQRVRMYRRKYK